MLTREDLDNPRHFVCLGWVPYFDEHEQYDADDKLVRKVDREWLERLCRTNNEKAATGDFSAFGPGHTIPNQRTKDGILVPSKEGDQPPHWGYSADWSVKPLPDGTLAAGAVRYVRRRVELPKTGGSEILDGKEAVGSFPWRSIEYDPHKGDVPYVALLRRPPERNVGAVVSFARQYETVLARGKSLRCSTARRARAAVQWGDRLYFSMEMNMDPEVKDPSEAPDAKALTADEKDHFMRCARECFPHLEKMHGEAKERYEAAPPVIPGSNNVALPDADKKPDEDMNKFEREMHERFERKHGERIKALETENASIKAARRMDDAKARCRTLADEGNVFDSKRLLQRFERMDDADRDAEMTFIRGIRRADHAPTEIIELGEPEHYERSESEKAKADHIERAKHHLRVKGYTGEAGWDKALAETK